MKTDNWNLSKVIRHHYRLGDDELDFIINYDIKYRMGVSAWEEEGDDG